jgi:polyhydroxybutyrate depolymerase
MLSSSRCSPAGERARMAAFAALLSLGAFAALGGACANANAKRRHARPHSRAVPPLPQASGCGNASTRTGDFHLEAVDGDGMSRDYEVVVPRGSGPFALTFVFHGSGSAQAVAKDFGLQSAPGAGASSVFVFPQGMPFKNDGVGWDDACDGYDMAFFDAMLSRLESDSCIDKNAVFAAGFSWGCDFVTALACCRGDRIRAVAAGSCSDDFSTSTEMASYLNLPCPASAHPAVRFTYDPRGDGAYAAEYFSTTSALYRSWDGCSQGSKPTADAACFSYEGCKSPFVECRYPGLGHALPGPWPKDTWGFFSGFLHSQ